MINVTQTFFPPLEEYNTQLKRVWNNKWLTNRGELVKELEVKLQDLLNSPPLTLTTNGTLPIQIALKAFANQGEVITTPFSYVATTSAIVWENCTPIFVDIHPEYLTIDESKIEAAITEKTTAILATHVFGNPCAVEKIESIARKYKLMVIYDAAHSFGVTYKNKSIFEFGDVSTCSFHATKLFHTGEGGAFFCKNENLHQKLFYHHNFGHNGPMDFYGLGTNAKMSEIQAAMGIAVLPYMEEISSSRKIVVEFYNKNLEFKNFRTMELREETNWNYSYYPLIFNNEESLIQVEKALNTENIFPRRYFYPSLNTLPYVKTVPMPVTDKISQSILCLPLYKGLEKKELNKIINTINQTTCLF